MQGPRFREVGVQQAGALGVLLPAAEKRSCEKSMQSYMATTCMREQLVR